MDFNATEEQRIHPTIIDAQHTIHLYDPVCFNVDPNDESPSCSGAGTLEILEVTRLFEEAGIPCCIVEISALIYFGAARIRNDWEICVPTNMLDKASELLKPKDIYEAYPPGIVQQWSLLHTFPRFKVRGKRLCFTIIPSEDSHLDCSSTNIERSRMGLPYPTLQTFTQSLLARNDRIALNDLVDGMNLTYEWGLENLELEGQTDVAWAERKNEKIRSSVPPTPVSCFLEVSVVPENLEEAWRRVIDMKDSRIGIECPKEVFVTRFRFRGDDDPRLRERDWA